MTTSCRPAIASSVNHSPMIGPNHRPTAPVPKRWIVNSTARITSVIGTTSSCRLGSTTSMPSTADSTEIAGVIMPSP